MRRRALAAAAACTLALSFAACGGDDDDSAGDDPAGETGDDTEAPDDGGDGGESGESGDDATGGEGVTASGFAFEPTELTVAAGSSIPLSNQDGSSHTFTVDDTDIDVELSGGSSGEATAPSEPGDYEFHCRFHSNMTGTLTVE